METSHRYLKEAVDQALMLRGRRDFADRPAYDEFVREVVLRRNRRNAAAFRIEREQLLDLPERRTTDFAEEEALVTRCSTFTVRGILYSAPSRLHGERDRMRMVRVPSLQDEASRHLMRDRGQLQKEVLQHRDRMRKLLITFGCWGEVDHKAFADRLGTR